MEIEKEHFVTSFSVLEDQTMDMLLGLDMLKRHQCTIDLQRNVLRIGTTGMETSFLPENELPTHSRLTLSGEDGVKAAEAEMKATADALEAEEIRKAIERSKQEGKPLQLYLKMKPTISSFCFFSSFAAAGSSSGARTSTSTTPSPARDVVLPTDQFTESDVAEIAKNGFPRERVIAELRSANGNKTQALAALFAKSLKFQ